MLKAGEERFFPSPPAACLPACLPPSPGCCQALAPPRLALPDPLGWGRLRAGGPSSRLSAPASLWDPAAARLFRAACTVSDGLRGAEPARQLCRGGSEGSPVTMLAIWRGRAVVQPRHQGWLQGPLPHVLSSCAPAVEGARCWDHPHLIPGETEAVHPWVLEGGFELRSA